MSTILIVKNKANGVESRFTQEQWQKLSPKQKAIFNVKYVPAPKEVQEFESKKAETAQIPPQKENEYKSTQEQKKDVKTKENNTGNQK